MPSGTSTAVSTKATSHTVQPGTRRWGYRQWHAWLAGARTPDVGAAPVLPLIKEYQDLGSFSDFAGKIAEFELAGKPNAFPFGVAPDFMNAQLNVLWAEAPETILPDTTYYAEDNEKGKELLAIWRHMQEELLAKFGFSAEEISDLLDKVIALDAK